MHAEGDRLSEAKSAAPEPRNPRQPRQRGGRATEVLGVSAERVIAGIETDPFLSLKALAGYSSLSVRTLRHIIDELPPEQALPCYRLPGKLLVRRSEFDAWLEQYRSRGRPSLVKALRELGLRHGA